MTHQITTEQVYEQEFLHSIASQRGTVNKNLLIVTTLIQGSIISVKKDTLVSKFRVTERINGDDIVRLTTSDVEEAVNMYNSI